MLVITRKLNEAVVIGNDIVVEVLDISGTQIKLGITAPQDIPIAREELLDVADTALKVEGLTAITTAASAVKQVNQ